MITDISNTPYNWTQTVQKLTYADSKDGTGDDEKFVVEVLNNPGAELPSTGGPGIRHGIVIRRPRHMSIPAYGGFGIRRFTILGSNLMHPDLRSRCTAVGMTGLDLTATS